MARTFEFGDRFYLEPARAGDWKALADYLERGGPITPAIREFLVEVLRGKRRPHKHRAWRAATWTRNLKTGGFVEEQKQQKAHDPILRAEKFFRLSRRSVQTAARKFDKLTAEQKDIVTAAKGWNRHRKGRN